MKIMSSITNPEGVFNMDTDKGDQSNTSIYSQTKLSCSVSVFTCFRFCIKPASD